MEISSGQFELILGVNNYNLSGHNCPNELDVFLAVHHELTIN